MRRPRVSREFVKALGDDARLFFRPFSVVLSHATKAALEELSTINSIKELRRSRHHRELDHADQNLR